MSRKLTYDKFMFVVAMLIAIVGLVVIYSASAIIAVQKVGEDQPFYFFIRQIVWLAAGAVLMLTVMHVDTSRIRDTRLVYLLLGAVGAALVLVLFQAPVNNTHRWFVLPFFQLQPSEIAKPVMILFIASYLSQREERINEMTTLVPLLAVIAAVTGLIILQPDFGTAFTIIGVATALVFVSGLSWSRIVVLGIVGSSLLSLVMVSAEYRRARLLSFLNPEADPLNSGYQAMQSLIAIGTGGVFGLGFGNGRQKLFFLPEPHTDFIFSIIGEELGFLGAMTLLIAFAFLVWRGLRVVQSTTDRFTFYAALGCTLMIAFQVLINVSVTLCLLPTKGLPLPFVSYGGSSLMTSMLLLGLLLNFSQQSN